MGYNKVMPYGSKRGVGLEISPEEVVYAGDLAYIIRHLNSIDRCLQIIRISYVGWDLHTKYRVMNVGLNGEEKFLGTEKQLIYSIKKVPSEYAINDFPDEWIIELLKNKTITSVEQLQDLGAV